MTQRKRTRTSIWTTAIGVALSAGSTHSAAQSPLTTLYTFTNGSDGGYPGKSHLIREKSGALYGATLQGGIVNDACPKGCGTIFKLTPPKNSSKPWKFTVAYSFLGGSDGASPEVLMRGAGGVFYGMTNSGGSYNLGTVFELDPPSSSGAPWTETPIYSFGGYSGDAASPVFNGLAQTKSGVLYGTTDSGGSAGIGAVFELTPPASPGGPWSESVICSFTSGHIAGGSAVGGLLLGKKGELYGAIETGGQNGYGFAYQLKKSGGQWVETDIHDFSGADGGEPITTLIEDSNGALYGTTFAGGSGSCGGLLSPGCGAVFMLTPPSSPNGTWTESVLHSFDVGGADGVAPAGGLYFGANGALLGTTTVGGGGSCFIYFEPGCGTVFELTPPAAPGPWDETILYSFAGTTDGSYPITGLAAGESGELYGTSSAGDGYVGTPALGYGTVFRIAP